MLERKVWLANSVGYLYPNMFTLLVAPPGVGKSIAITTAQSLVARTGQIRLGPSKLTAAGLIDVMADGQKRMHLPDNPDRLVLTSPLALMSTEFGVLLPSHDTTMLNTLNELYDCGVQFNEYTRGGGAVSFDHPCLNLVAGTQPKYLAGLMPEEAWGMGYTSRIVMVYAGEKVEMDFFDLPDNSSSISEGALVQDLKTMSTLHGGFQVTNKTKELFRNWQKSGFEPVPDHSRLQHYATRRPTHAFKIAMVFSASRSNSLVVEEQDMQAAIDHLLEAESLMPEIFKEMVTTDNYEILEETFRLMYKRHKSTNKPIAEAAIVNFLSARVPSNMIDYTINTMLRAGIIKEQGKSPVGIRQFVPLKIPNPRDLSG